MSDVTFGTHWLSFTVHAPKENAFALYDNLFREEFGDLIDMQHGGKYFKEVYQSTFGFKLYLSPSTGSKEYFFFEIPGEACEHILWAYYQALEIYMSGNFPGNYAYKRIDLAFDHVGFTPHSIRAALDEGLVRSLAKRESFQIDESPFKLKENGDLGTCTVYFGDRSSERMIRVYDQRGFTRLEFEVKERRADLVAKDIFNCDDPDRYFSVMIGHLRDFTDFNTEWWESFVSGEARANATVSKAKEVSLAKLTRWLDKQVAPALSVAADTLPESFLTTMVKRGRNRRGPKYNHLLQNSQE